MGTYIPNKISAGVDFHASVGHSAYSAGDWQLTLYLRGPLAIDLPFDRDASRHVLNVSAGATSAWPAGTYAYTLRAACDDSVQAVESGSVTILPDLAAQSAGFDGRSQNRIALDAIEAVLAKRATMDQQRYRINNRELYRMDVADLLKLRSFYQEQCQREEAHESGRNTFGQVIKYRMRDGF